MKLQEVTAYNLRSATILNESWQDLTESQRIYVGRWEKELWPLLEEYTKVAEATLTANQIQAIFKGAEAQADASGDNKNLLGKGASAAAAAAKLPVDIAKKVDAKINELGRLAQNAGPVKNMDQKFEQLKKDITANNSDSKIVQGIQKVSDWAKENPGKASIAVGILTTIAAFAGGPAGGAAAGLVLRASKDLLQGEKLSTAVGKSVKTAAYGALAGMAFQKLTDAMIDNLAVGAEEAAVDLEQQFMQQNFDTAAADAFADAGIDPGALDGVTKLNMAGNVNGWNWSYDTVMTPDQRATFDSLRQAIGGENPTEVVKSVAKFHDFATQVTDQNRELTALYNTIKDIPKDQLTSDQFVDVIQVLDNADQAIEKVMDIGGKVGAAAQGALSTVDSNNKEMHNVKPIDPKEKEQLELDLKGGGDKKESLSMEDRFEMFLMEKDPTQGELPLDNPNTMAAKAKRGIGSALGKVGGAIKKGAGAAVGAAKSAGKELGSKVTYNKLMKSWKAAGEPADTASIMNILQDAGLNNDQIATIGQEAKVDLGKPSAKPAADVQNTAQNNAQTGANAQNTAQTGNKLPSAQNADNTDQLGKGDAGKNTKQTKTATAKPIKKGDTREVNGKTYKWAGALWVDTATNKPVGVIPSMKMGLPNPKLQPIIDAAKKDPKLAKLIKQQVMSKGVEAGSAGAQKAAQAGVKGTEKLDAKGVTR